MELTKLSYFEEVPEILKIFGKSDSSCSMGQGLSAIQDQPFFCHSWATVDTSFFKDSNTETSIDLKKENEKRINNFLLLIQKRIKYINSLKNIPEDWISGKSKKPTDNVIELSTVLLDTLFLIINDTDTQIPELVLGPIPSGGISINIIFDNQDRISVSFFNENLSEIDYSKSGNYFCLDIEKENTVSKFEGILRNLIY